MLFRSTLPLSVLSLFRAVTLEDWTDLMYINQLGCDRYGYLGTQNEALCTAPQAFPLGSPALFVSLVLLGTMIVMNLFIGVIMNGMDTARAEREEAEIERKRLAAGERQPSVAEDLATLARQLEAIQQRIVSLQGRAEKEEERRSESLAA